jgi:hypothetical protein
MIHWYMWYNGHRLTIRVSFMVKCVCVSFESNGFEIKQLSSLFNDGYVMCIGSGYHEASGYVGGFDLGGA